MAALVLLHSLWFTAWPLRLRTARFPKVWPYTFGRLGLLPVTIAGLWLLRDAIACTRPYGGFPWGRVAMSQSDSSLSFLIGWVGMYGVGVIFLVVLAAAGAAGVFQFGAHRLL